MRIGLSTSVIQRGRSGVGQYVLSLTRALLPSAGQHEFVLYVLEEDLPLFDFARTAMQVVPVSERFRPAVRNIWWHQTELPRLAQRDGLDVLHVPSYRRMLWSRPCALVATIHDLAPFELAGKYDWARMFYGRVVARQLAHRQDEIVAVSQLTADGLGRYFKLNPDHITVVPNGLDHEQFRLIENDPAPRACCMARGVTQPFFLYIARLEHPAKNHVRLIESFNRFKATTGSPWQLVLGGSDWHGAGYVHAAAEASPFARDIIRLGFVPTADLPAWYRAAGALAFPSLYEGFGLPPIEAMACGCPVLSSTRGALGETVAYAAGVLNPDSVEQMTAQLTRVASDPEWREELRDYGLIRAQRFAWSKTAAATLAVYHRAFDRARHAVPQPPGEPIVS